MRVIFIGASSLTVQSTPMLLAFGHEVIIIEADRARIDELAPDLDCAFIHGDGTRPAILGEVAPQQCDFLFCITGNDQTNIIASLVGRSLGFARVVTKVTDQEFEHICLELGLEHTIIPDRTIAHHLLDMLSGQDALELSALIKDDARLFSFLVPADLAGPVADLDLPRGARAICYYRDSRFHHVHGDTHLKRDDELVILTHSEDLEELRRRWASPTNGRLAP